MSYLFPPDRSLLFPQFETYRLGPTSSSSAAGSDAAGAAAEPVLYFPLPTEATQSRVAYGAPHPLSFVEVRSRIGWNHLSTGEGGRGVYVDVDWQVVGFSLDPTTLQPTFSILERLPTPLGPAVPEYPCARPLDSTHWCISSGTGSIYILHTSPLGQEFTGSFIARYDLPSAVQLHAVALPSPSSSGNEGGRSRLLLSRAVVPDSDSDPKGKGRETSHTGSRPNPRATEFEILEVQIDSERTNEVDKGEEVDPVWVLRGNDLPFWCARWEDGWLVLSGAEFKLPQNTQEPEENREKREREEKVARLGLGATLPEAMQVDASSGPSGSGSGVPSAEAGEEADSVPALFSWTQGAESLNLVIPLHGATRSDVSVSLTTDTLTLALSSSAPDSTSISSLAQLTSPRARALWGEIDVSSSTWTFDTSSPGGTLELSLTKNEVNTRWPSVFAPEEMDEDEDFGNPDLDVPETLDEAVLAAVRASFDAVKTRGENGESGDPAGAHPGIPALLREEMDFDLEDDPDEGESGAFGEVGGAGKVGRDVLVGCVKDGGGVSWSKQTTAVLSTPLAVSSNEEASGTGTGKVGVIVKSGVDGLLFNPRPGSDPATTPWAHGATNPALAFVISSKRDLRHVAHLALGSGPTVYAFDAGTSSAGQGNVYIYRPPQGSKTHATQGIAGVSGSERGALLGVGRVVVGGTEVVLGLCERQLVVIRV